MDTADCYELDVANIAEDLIHDPERCMITTITSRCVRTTVTLLVDKKATRLLIGPTPDGRIERQVVELVGTLDQDERLWALCPGCGERIVTLYAEPIDVPSWRCRKCHRLKRPRPQRHAFT